MFSHSLPKYFLLLWMVTTPTFQRATLFENGYNYCDKALEQRTNAHEASFCGLLQKKNLWCPPTVDQKCRTKQTFVIKQGEMVPVSSYQYGKRPLWRQVNLFFDPFVGQCYIFSIIHCSTQYQIHEAPCSEMPCSCLKLTWIRLLSISCSFRACNDLH